MKSIRRFTVCAALAASVCIAALLPAGTAEAAARVTAPYIANPAKLISGAEYEIMVRLSGKYITAAADGNIATPIISRSLPS